MPICSISLLRRGHRGIFFSSDNFKKSSGCQWGFIMLLLALVVSQFPAQYNSVRKLGSTFESLLCFREFFLRLLAIFLSGRGNVILSKITSRR